MYELNSKKHPIARVLFLLEFNSLGLGIALLFPLGFFHDIVYGFGLFFRFGRFFLFGRSFSGCHFLIGRFSFCWL